MEETKNNQVIKPIKYTQPTNFIDFLKRQYEIFRKDFIHNNKVKREGIICALPDLEYCYYVALTFSDEVNAKIEKFSKEISNLVPAVAYNPANIHTTLANGYITRGDFKVDNNIINKLNDIVLGASKKKIFPLVHHSWLINSGGIISAAYGNEGFFNVAYEINQEAKKRGLELNFPWGAHMSVNRFSESKRPDQIKDLLSFIEQAKPLGQISPIKITLGTAYTTKNEFLLNEYSRVSI